jgi:DNA-binding transcriptional LysR family regulator
MHPRNVDLNLLRAFDALIDERSVTRAASRLALTQPAVSGILNRLRDSFGDPLFVRTQRGITPTPRALELMGPIKRVLADIEGILTPTAFEPAGADFTLSLAATDYALRAVVVPFIAALRPLAPGIRVAVRQIDEGGLLEQMERGELDMALLTPQTAPADLHSRSLFDEHYVCVLREGHPLADGAGLSLEQFCALDHAMVSLRGGGFSGATDEALARLGRSRRVRVSVPSFVMLLDIVRSSDLLALVPRRLLQDAQGLRQIEPPLEVAGFTKILAWHARTHDDPGQRWVRALLLQSCAAQVAAP